MRANSRVHTYCCHGPLASLPTSHAVMAGCDCERRICVRSSDLAAARSEKEPSGLRGVQTGAYDLKRQVFPGNRPEPCLRIIKDAVPVVGLEQRGYSC